MYVRTYTLVIFLIEKKLMSLTQSAIICTMYNYVIIITWGGGVSGTNSEIFNARVLKVLMSTLGNIL